MQEVERYSKFAIFQHWWIVACSLLLGITGLFLFLSWVSPGAWWGVSRVAHRVAAVGFDAIPVLYMVMRPKATLEWIKEAFTWGGDDIGWLKAAPTYYFGGDEGAMPPQDRSNTGQKLWMVVVIFCGISFVISGAIMWFAPGGNLGWAVLWHDIAFIVGAAMLLVHVMLPAFHPRFAGSLRSMVTGKVTVEYARSHHQKWYERIAGASRA